MLVRITKNKNKNEWDIECLSGDLYRKHIATAEGVRLSSPHFQINSITGHLHALLGAQVSDAALDDMDVAMSLGINGCFRPCHAEAVYDRGNTGWFDAQTREPLADARYVTAMGGRVFYSTQAHVNEERQSLPTPGSVGDASITFHQEGYLRTFMTHMKRVFLGG